MLKHHVPKVIQRRTITKGRVTKTIPDQTMSIQEIVTRFTRNLPSNVYVNTPVYVDQDQYDLEKLNRMNFGDKADMAVQMRSDNEALEKEIVDKAEAKRKAKEDALKKKAEEASKKAGDGDPGIA